ncbi:MAG TPA: LacI family DNA-binding transcriptional regulator [Alphaproteobacteria bacterium]|nr:LacI family DNA-binding transcriptional regulator [Alphaproteobacteria bacterium]
MTAKAEKRRKTIRDIAREARVSTATVSRVLNGSAPVRPDTRERVEHVIERHHFVFDGLAGGLASRRSGLLGLVIPTVINSIYAAFAQSIQAVAQKERYTVLLGVSEFSPAEEERLIEQFIARRVEALILTGADRPARSYQQMRRNQVPFIITWKSTRRRDLPSVSFDNGDAARKAVSFLLQCGHRRIGLICGRTGVNDRARERRDAFETTLKERGITVDPELVCECDFEFDAGRAAMQGMLRRPDPPTAVFCANDIQAIGAITECRGEGIPVPGGMSIVGFDDLPIATFVDPQLTTIRVPAAEMGRLAAEAVIAHLTRHTPLGSIVLPTELIVRSSASGPMPAGRPW